MKKLLLLPLLIVFVNTGCEKEPVINSPSPITITPPPPPPPPPPTSFRLPLVYNWYNIYDEWISEKSDTATLSAYTPTTGSVSTYNWRKISGPGNPIIDDPTKLTTHVRNLQSGDYVFEITARDASGQSDSDLVRVYVIKPESSNVILKNFSWICPMGCSSQSVKKIYSFLPRNVTVKVSVKYADSNKWELIDPWGSWYISNEENFSLYADWPREDEQFDIKIEF